MEGQNGIIRATYYPERELLRCDYEVGGHRFFFGAVGLAAVGRLWGMLSERGDVEFFVGELSGGRRDKVDKADKMDKGGVL